jgi:hypothetical protein
VAGGDYADQHRNYQEFVTEAGTRTRRVQSAGPFSDIMAKRT